MSDDRSPQQLSFDFDDPSLAPREFTGPVFERGDTRPVHRWLPGTVSLASTFVHDALERFAPRPSVVLDPVAGDGAALFEAQLAGHEVIGFETHPFPALVTALKLGVGLFDLRVLWEERERFRDTYGNCLSHQVIPRRQPPYRLFDHNPYLNDEARYKALLVLDFIDTITDDLTRLAFRIAFGAVTAGPMDERFEADDALLHQLDEIEGDITLIQSVYTPSRDHSVYNTSFFDVRDHLPPRSVDLVMAAPPRLTAATLQGGVRPIDDWLDWVASPDAASPQENAHFGSSEHAGRAEQPIELWFQHPQLIQQLEQLRSLNPYKGAFGGMRWANSAAVYFNDCYRFLLSIKAVLKPTGNAVIVTGGSVLQGLRFPTDRYLADLAEGVGLKVEELQMPQTPLNGNGTKPAHPTPSESILTLTQA